MEKYQNKVGSIVSVSGNNVIIQLFESVKSSSLIIDGMVYRIGQIGSFVKIPLGNTILFGIVTKAGAEATADGDVGDKFKLDADSAANQQWVSATLIGEQIGTKFERGISQSPITGDSVHIVTLSDLVFIYGGYNEETSINIGNISVSASINAYLNLDKLISRHFAILGSTGSGKSNAVGVVINAIIAKQLPRTRILMLDPHGEYSSIFGDTAKVFKVNALRASEKLLIPYWALSFREFINLFDEELNEQGQEALREKIVEVKIRSASVNNIQIDPQMIGPDSPIPFNLQQLWFDAPNKQLGGLGSSFVGSDKKDLHGFLNAIGTKLKDPRYDFLLKPGDYTPDFWGKVSKNLTELIVSWIGTSDPITILDISDIPSEIMMPIAGTLLNIIYEALYWGQETQVGGREQPLLVVLEEAHNYLRAGDNSIASRTVQRIAKEGRKYGLGLLLVTQRPTELDETVLSQCGTIIALRMNNSKDIQYVSAAVQDELKAIVEMLPSLRIGESVISGESVSIPSRVQFYKLPKAPKSSDPDVSEKWSKPFVPGENDYRDLVTLWMNKRFNMQSVNMMEHVAMPNENQHMVSPPPTHGAAQHQQGYNPGAAIPQQGFAPGIGQPPPPSPGLSQKRSHSQYDEFFNNDGY